MKKKSQKQTKHDLRSEAAQREAIRLAKESKVYFKDEKVYFKDESDGMHYNHSPFVYALRTWSDELIAIFDLRDCYRKRAPLKGITKAVRKAVQPRKKK